MNSTEELRAAYHCAQNGSSPEGAITIRETYLRYKTVDSGGAQYFELRIGKENGEIESSSEPEVRQAMMTAMSVVPDAQFRLKNGEQVAEIQLD